MNYLKFSENLRKILKEKNISQQKLADKLGTTQQTISRWVKGENEPDLQLLIEICLFLDESPNDLLGYNDIINNSNTPKYHIGTINNNGNIDMK